MSQVTSILPDVAGLASSVQPERPSREAREYAIDSIIEANRDRTPPAVLDQRRVQRYSVSEINASTVDEIKRRFDSTYRDNRDPVTRVLDLIELPRNVIANVLFRDTAESQGDRGAFGLPRVAFSDVLDEMGVENRVIRGVVGFVGDVVLDPLTYLTAGTSAGLTLAGKGGRLALSSTGRSMLQKGARRAARAGTIDAIEDTAVRSVFRGLGVTDDVLRETAERAAREGAANQKAIRRAIEGEIDARTIGRLDRSAASGVTRIAGLNPTARQSPLADLLTDAASGAPDIASEVRQAAGEFFARAQRGSVAPGSGFRGLVSPRARAEGVGRSLVGIPFTDVGIRIAASPGERAAAALARAATRPPAEAVLSPGATRAIQFADEAEQFAREVAQRTEDVRTLRRGGHDLAANDALDDLNRVISEADLSSGRYSAAIRAAEQTGVDALFSAEDVAAQARRLALQRATTARAREVAEQARERYAAILGRSLAREIDDTAEQAVELSRRLAARYEDEGLGLSIEDAQRLAETAIGDRDRLLDDMADRLVDDIDNPDLLPAMRAEAQSLNQAFAAHFELQNALAAPLLETTKLTGRERIAAELAKRFLRTDDDTLGMSILAPFGAMLRQRNEDGGSAIADIGDQIASSRRAAFQNRGASDHFDLVKPTRRIQGPDGQRLVQQMVDRDFRAVQSIAKSYGLPTNAQTFDNVGTLMGAMAIQRLADRAGGAAFPTTSFTRPGEPAAWITRIQQARADGLLSEKLYPGLATELGRVVDQRLAQLDQMAADAVDDGLLSIVRRYYFPNTLTREGAEAVRIARQGGSRVRSAGATEQAFQRARTTDQVRFVDPETGEELRFLEADRVYLARSYRDLQNSQLTPEQQALIAERQEAIRRYDALPADVQAEFPPMPTDPFELNEMVESGRMAHLFQGADLPRGAFEANLFAAMAQRTLQQARAANKAALEAIVRDRGFFLPSEWKTQAQSGGTVTLVGGVQAKVLPATSDRPARLLIGGETFRPLAADVADPNRNPLAAGLISAANVDAVYPERFAQMIEATSRHFMDDELTKTAFQLADRLTGMWRTATLAAPSWLVGNVIGNTILSLNAGINPRTYPASFRKALRLIARRGRYAADETVDIRGEAVNAERYMEDSALSGTVGQTVVNEIAKDLAGNSHLMFRDGRFLAGARERWADAASVASTSELLGRLPAGRKLGRYPIFVGKQAGAAIGAWFKLNQRVDDTMRLATQIDLMENGRTFPDAALRTVQNLFDYSDLSRFERNVAKRLLPFYTWLRFATAQQATMMLKHPAYAGLAPKLVHAMTELAAGENALPEHMTPRWISEQMSIQIGTDPEERFAFTAGSLIPAEGVYRLLGSVMGGEGLMEALNFVISGTSPVIRIPSELALGREFFTDRRIGPDQLSGDLSLPEYLVNQIRPARELFNPFSPREGAMLEAFGRSFGEGIGRLALSGRIQPLSDERARYNLVREMNEAEDGIRRAIRIAEREGRTDLSQMARAELLRMYQDAIEKGLGDEVPLWARTMLQEFGAPSEPVYALRVPEETG